MGSVVKWLLGIAATLVVLIVIAFLCIPFLIDPNDYKDKITQVVVQQTGRELSIPGDIKLSVSPSLKAVFSLGDVRLSSNKNFQGTEFFSSKLVDINLALWPLIRSKKLVINQVGLKGVNVNLIRSKEGVTNWSDLTGGGGTKPKAGGKQPEKKQAKAQPAKTIPEIDIGGINVEDVNIIYTDQQAARSVKLTNFNLHVGHIVQGRSFPFDANFAIAMDDGKKPLAAATEMDGNLTFDLAKLLFLVDGLKLKADISGAPVPVRIVTLQLSARADIGKSQVDIKDLQARIDDTGIDGTASITDLAKPSYKADLHIDQLDLNRFKAEKKTAAAVEGKKESSPAATAPAAGTSAIPQEQKIETADTPLIPAALLRGLTFDAEVKIDKLLAGKLATSNILVKAAGKDGLVQLQPLSANLYQGTLTVNANIDVRHEVPEVKLTKVLQGVELGPLFMDLQGKEEIKGTADIRADFITQGLTRRELTRNANGTMKLSLANGEIAKLKIIDTIRIAKKMYEVGTKNVAALAAGGGHKSGRPTSFAELSASGVITNGVFKNDDLRARSELMQVTGKGTVDLNTEQINYLLTIYLAKRLEREEDKDLVEMADTPIPYRISGTFDKINQSAALSEILKAGAVQFLSKELDKQLGGDKSGTTGKKDAADSAEKLINKGLKSLFGK